MKTRSVNIAWHIAGCCALLFLPILLSPHPPEETGYLYSLPTIRDFIANSLMLVFFYVNYFFLIPKVYQRKHTVYYFLIVFAALFIIGSAPSLFTGRIGNGHVHPGTHLGPPPGPGPGDMFDDDGPNFLSEIKHHIYLFFSVVLFSLLLATRSQWYESERARQTAELAYLKSQINPHFLFNTLNNIYSLALRKDDHTADAVIHLSDLMRYIIRDAQDNMVLLWKELQYIDNYIALQKSRLGASATIVYQQKGSAGALQIAPLILISFIENAFKHGINPDEDSRIGIKIMIEDSKVDLYVENAKVTKVFKEDGETGVGLPNTMERLRLLYGGKHQLDVEDGATLYSVHLRIAL